MQDSPRYASPYGKAAGLADRLAMWRDRLATDRTVTWFGTGLIADLELAMRLLDLREYAEWLKLHGPPEHQAFADDILSDQDTVDSVRQAVDTAGYRHVSDPVKAVEMLDEESRGERIADVRKVLVDMGALAADDLETNLPDLLRALLS